MSLYLCLVAHDVRAEEHLTAVYTVEGQLRCNLPGGRELKETFVVAVSNSTWSIQITIPERPLFQSFEQVYNGDVLCSLTRFATNVALNQRSSTGRKPLNNDSTATVEQTDVPNNKIGTYAGQLWLAFASYRAFQDNRDGRLQLAWFVNDRLRAQGFRTRAVWRTSEGPPHLPEEIDYFFDKEAFAAAQGFPDSRHAPTGGTDNNRLWASYRAGVFTNIGRLFLPVSFHYEQYEPMARDVKSPLVFSVDGQVTAIRSDVIPGNIKVTLGKLTVLEDRRLAAGSPTTYVIKNGVLPPASNSVLQRLSAAAKKMELPLRMRQRTRRTEACVFVALAFGGAPVLLVAFRLCKRKRFRGNTR